MDLNNQLEFKDVNFKYLNDKQKDSFNLIDLNLKIKKNQTIGIIGRIWFRKINHYRFNCWTDYS